MINPLGGTVSEEWEDGALSRLEASGGGLLDLFNLEYGGASLKES